MWPGLFQAEANVGECHEGDPHQEYYMSQMLHGIFLLVIGVHTVD
jgi:hypothetical protein